MQGGRGKPLLGAHPGCVKSAMTSDSAGDLKETIPRRLAVSQL